MLPYLLFAFIYLFIYHSLLSATHIHLSLTYLSLTFIYHLNLLTSLTLTRSVCLSHILVTHTLNNQVNLLFTLLPSLFIYPDQCPVEA